MGRFLAVLLVAALTIFPPCVSAGWSFSAAYHDPLAPDTEHRTTFTASLGFINETAEGEGSAGNGTGTNGTGTDGAGANGTGTNGTGTNGTGTNPTVNVTACRLVIEPQDNRSAAPIARHDMLREGSSNDFSLTLGPWPAMTEILYHYEANLSNGTIIRSNSSWVRTPDLLAVAWHHEYDEAGRTAQGLGRPLMVLAYSGYAQTTRQLDEKVFTRPGVLALSAGFVCCRIDNETAPEFSLEHGLGRLPVLVFVNATTGKELARLENPFDGALVEKEMRYLLGKGPRPSAAEPGGPQYRLEALAIGTALVAGPVAMYALLRLKKRGEKG